MSVDYDPIARHGVTTTVTVHMTKPPEAQRSVALRVNQQMIEPMGVQRSIPLANSSELSNGGMRLTFAPAPDQPTVLVRFELQPNTAGIIALHVSDGTESVDWSMLVVP